jgi:L-arabinokinase
MSSTPRLVYYIDGHGFGHATRSLAILRELHRQRPHLSVIVRTSAPGFLFRDRQCGELEVLSGEVGPGTVQADPLTLDVTLSVAAAKRFRQSLPRRAAEDVARLAPYGVAAVVGDIPPLAFEVAGALGVPSLALGNFSWDWIYEPYLEGSPDGRELLASMRSAYAQADGVLRMPLHGDLSCFRQVEDIPHVVRASGAGRAEVRRALGLTHERRPLVLVSFGGFGAVRFAPTGAVSEMADFRFVVPGPLPPGLPGDTVVLAVDHPIAHEDLVAACDVVLSKPGYGTVVECLASRTPLLYTSRDQFREYAVLVAGLEREARCRFLPRGDLLALRWNEHLAALLADTTEWPGVRTDGAAVAAARILQLLDAAA